MAKKNSTKLKLLLILLFNIPICFILYIKVLTLFLKNVVNNFFFRPQYVFGLLTAIIIDSLIMILILKFFSLYNRKSLAITSIVLTLIWVAIFLINFNTQDTAP